MSSKGAFYPIIIKLYQKTAYSQIAESIKLERIYLKILKIYTHKHKKVNPQKEGGITKPNNIMVDRSQYILCIRSSNKRNNCKCSIPIKYIAKRNKK